MHQIAKNIHWLLLSYNIKDSGKQIDTMANVSNLGGNPICVVIDNFQYTVKNVTIQVQLPHKIDTLAIVSNFLPESYNLLPSNQFFMTYCTILVTD